MTVRDHRNPYLRQRKQQDRENRANARKKKRNLRSFGYGRANWLRDLPNLINSD